MNSIVRRATLAACAVSLGLGLAACADGTETDPVSQATDTTSPSSEESVTPEETMTGTETETPTEEPATTAAAPVYFVTDAGVGPRLVREFVQVEGDTLTEAARLVAGGTAADPDYRTLWPAVEIGGVSARDGGLQVNIVGDEFTERPDGMTRRDARLAIQQMVYTLQGVQQDRLPVTFVRDAGSTLFGLSIDEPFTEGSALQVLNHVNITAPAEGDSVTGASITVTGVANSFEANVICELRVGNETVAQEAFTAEGWMEDRLFPFEGELPLADAPAGEAILTCSDDVASGEEGVGAFTDTKQVTIG